MIKNAINTLIITHNAIRHKSKKLKSNRLDLNILKKMYSLNLIKFVKKCNYSNKLEIKVNQKLKLKLKIYLRKNSKIYFSKKQILKNKLHLFSTIYIFSTNKGLLTQHEMVNNQLGGFLITKIVLY